MKLMASRPNRSDFSDVAGIFWEKSKKGSAFLKSNIEYAIQELYGNTKSLSEESLIFFNNLFNTKDYEKLYNLYVRKERVTKKILNEVKKKDLLNSESTNFQNNVRVARRIVNNIYNESEQSLIEKKVIKKPDNENKDEYIPKSITELKVAIIKQNLDMCYGKQFEREYQDMQSQDKNGKYYEMNKTIYNESFDFYKNTIKNLSSDNLINLHKRFNVENAYSDIKDVHFCRFKNERLKIYNCIEKKCIEVINNNYSHLKDVKSIDTGNSGNSGGR